MKRDSIVQLVTFATSEMTRSQDTCYLSALTKGGVERGFQFSQWDVTRLRDYDKHKALFDAGRGPGFWAWKPALINKVLGPDSFLYDVTDGDMLVYADAGVEFINNVSHIIDRMDQDIFLFGNNWEHAHWCKRDVIEAVWPLFKSAEPPKPENLFANSDTWRRFGKQAQASVIFFRVSDYTRAFVKEWLDWCLFEGGRLIDDSPSRLPNHPEFREHRHDQAILTTLAYREGIKLHYWPAVYNKGGSPEFVYEKLPEYAGDDYPVLFSHHRRRNHEWKQVA